MEIGDIVKIKDKNIKGEIIYIGLVQLNELDFEPHYVNIDKHNREMIFYKQVKIKNLENGMVISCLENELEIYK